MKNVFVIVAFMICSNICSVATAAVTLDQARAECRRHFGGTVELDRVDNANGYIYCRSKGYKSVEKIPIAETSKNSASGTHQDVTNSQKLDSSIPATETGCVGLDCNVETKNLSRPAEAPSDRQNLMQQASRICVDRYGPSSTVHHMDYYHWQVFCNVPEK